MNKKIISILVFLLLLSGFGTANIYAADLRALDVIKNSEAVYPGMDQQSKLTFLIQNQKNPEDERKFVLQRYWKRYEGTKKDKPISKVIVFNKYPPDSKGSAFMVWSYRAASGKKDDQWLYIPILGKVEKVPNPVDEMFGEASLRPSEMGPRDPGLDNHTLLKEEVINNQKYYVVESRPKKIVAGYNYGRVVKWITKDSFLKEKAEYYNVKGKLLKTEQISWSRVDNAWVWQKVIISDKLSDVIIIISIKDIKVDLGLTDDLFSEKTMKAGVGQ